MRACISRLEVATPKDLGGALRLLAARDDHWQALAGGTDLMVALSAGKLASSNFIDLWQLHELRGICVEESCITLGALTTYAEILQHEKLCAEFPLLAAAASETGSVATQNRGTLGGNIMNASPAADSPPALLVNEAEVELRSVRGSRWVQYRKFHTGYKETVRASDELLTRIRLPRLRSQMRSCYRKVGPRRTQAISKLCFAALAGPDNQDIRIAFGSVAPVPLRCFETEACIRTGRGDPCKVLATELAPINDMRSTAAYRIRVAQNLLSKFLTHEF